MFYSSAKVYVDNGLANLSTNIKLEKVVSSRFNKLSWLTKDRQLTFTDLKAIESYRRALLVHTKTGRSIDFMFSFTGTLLPYLLTDYLFWFTMCVYGLVRFITWQYPANSEYFPAVLLPQVIVVGGFLNFFLVFFTSHSYTRFMLQYQKLMLAKGAIFSLTLLAKNHLPRARAMRMVRWLQTCFLLAFVGLSVAYENENFFVPICEKYQLLNKSEKSRINEIGADSGGIAYREMLSWITDDVAALGKERVMPDKIGDSMWKEIIRLNENLAIMFDYEDQPIPYVYVHFTYIISLAYLPLLAFTLATGVMPDQQRTGVELFGFLILFACCLFVLGLRDLGHILQDPFGDDLQDMSVLHYVTYTIQMSRRLLLAKKQGACDDSWEMQTDSERPDLGKGFAVESPTDAPKQILSQPSNATAAVVVEVAPPLSVLAAITSPASESTLAVDR